MPSEPPGAFPYPAIERVSSIYKKNGVRDSLKNSIRVLT